MGYRLNEDYWNKKIATNVLKLMVEYLVNKVNITILELIITKFFNLIYYFQTHNFTIFICNKTFKSEQKCLRHAPSEKLLIVKVKTIEITVPLWFSSYSL